MTTNHSQTRAHTQTNPNAAALSFLGVVFGVLTGFAVLQGDDLGRVNLLYLLFLFCFVPALSLVLSLSALPGRKAKGYLAALLDSPLWPATLQQEFITQKPGPAKKYWLLIQSQFLALSFAMGNLLVLLMVLLGSDINFIWRSSLLDASSLLPILKFIALPWFFWGDAQPTLALIQSTQDFRLNSEGLADLAPGLWWKYLVAAQCSYNLVPRVLLFCYARQQYSKLTANSISVPSRAKPGSAKSPTIPKHELAAVVVTMPSPYDILQWAYAPDHCLNAIEKYFGRAENNYLVDHQDLNAPLQNKANKVMVVVKAWEPPLAELHDHLQLNLDATNVELYLFPTDWNESQLLPPSSIHVKEWRRFAATLKDCRVIQPNEWASKETLGE